MYETDKMGGWLLFLAVTKWLIIISTAVMTVSIVGTYAGQGVDGELFWILVCGLVSCAAEYVQFRALKKKKFFSEYINNKQDLLMAFGITEAVSCIAMCIFYNKCSGTWISMLMSELGYIAIWGSYLYKSKRVDAYL